MPARRAHIIITGANGYLGNHLQRAALAEGRIVTCLGRTAMPSTAGVRWIRWTLGDPLPALDALPEDAAIIHLAHDWEDRSTDGTNWRGTRLLVESARKSGVKRFVFVSSLSSRRDALNAYGRIKFAIEQSIAGPDAVAARVGLVYGGARKGLMAC